MNYIVQRNGTYHYRRHVPRDIQPHVDKAWWKISLKTGNRREAEEKARAQAVAHDQLIASIRTQSEWDQFQQLDAKDASYGADPTKAFGRPHQRIARASLELSESIYDRQAAKAATQLGKLSGRELLAINENGGVAPFLDAVGREAIDVSALQASVERDVRRKHLSAASAIVRKLGVDAHSALLNNDLAHEKNPRLSDAIEGWFGDRKQGASAIARHRVAVRRFIELQGNLTVQEVTRDMVRSYRKAIEGLADHRRLPTRQRGGIADGQEDGIAFPRVSAKTVERHLTTIKALLTWCMDQDFVSTNVATGIKPPTDTRPKASKRRAFERSELQTLLTRVVEEDGTNGDKAWFVRLCAYTGIRLEEAAQLARKNVRQLDGTWIIEIDDLDGRHLKSETSVKQIPLHPAIRDDFVTWSQGGQGDRVFASFRPDSGRFVNKLSGDFARLMDRAGLTDPRLVFHSLRHTLKREMSNARVDPDMRRQILGHAPRSAHDGYAGASMKTLADELGKVPALFQVAMDGCAVGSNRSA